MIPKKLWFIWFGKKPNYVDFCIKSFKDINPDFEINFIYKESLDFKENDNIDLDIKMCSKWIQNPSECPYKGILLYDTSKKYNQYVILSDLLRVVVINKYGGIYLDCDTFPIKPFDDKLLNLNNFCITSFNNELLYKGRYFFGKCHKGKFDTKMLFPTRLKYNNYFIECYKEFQGCTLKNPIPENNLTYIEHYSLRYIQKKLLNSFNLSK